MREDASAECRYTTMFDFYALPSDFPGAGEAAKIADPYKKVSILEAAMTSDISDRRFIPYIQLHEFEALILCDPAKLSCEYLERDSEIAGLVSFAAGRNPELIDDGLETAPSKRIMSAIPEYDKATAGVAIAEKIGLEVLMSRCAHFGEWMERLGVTA